MLPQIPASITDSTIVCRVCNLPAASDSLDAGRVDSTMRVRTGMLRHVVDPTSSFVLPIYNELHVKTYQRCHVRFVSDSVCSIRVSALDK